MKYKNMKLKIREDHVYVLREDNTYLFFQQEFIQATAG